MFFVEWSQEVEVRRACKLDSTTGIFSGMRSILGREKVAQGNLESRL